MPLLDSEIVEFVATIPAALKFKGGRVEVFFPFRLQRAAAAQIANRRDKMGFPVPLNEWLSGRFRDTCRTYLPRNGRAIGRFSTAMPSSRI